MIGGSADGDLNAEIIEQTDDDRREKTALADGTVVDPDDMPATLDELDGDAEDPPAASPDPD